MGIAPPPPPEGVAALVPGSQLRPGHAAPLRLGAGPPSAVCCVRNGTGPALPLVLPLVFALPTALLLAPVLVLLTLVLAWFAGLLALLRVPVPALPRPAPLERLAKGRMRGEGTVRRTPIPPLPGLAPPEPAAEIPEAGCPGAGGPGAESPAAGGPGAGGPCENLVLLCGVLRSRLL